MKTGIDLSVLAVKRDRGVWDDQISLRMNDGICFILSSYVAQYDAKRRDLVGGSFTLTMPTEVAREVARQILTTLKEE